MCILAGTRQADEAGQRLHPLDPRLRTIRPSELSLAALLIHWAQARALHHQTSFAAVGRSRRALRPLLTERGRTSHSKGSSKGFSKAGPVVRFLAFGFVFRLSGVRFTSPPFQCHHTTCR